MGVWEEAGEADQLRAMEAVGTSGWKLWSVVWDAAESPIAQNRGRTADWDGRSLSPLIFGSHIYLLKRMEHSENSGNI